MSAANPPGLTKTGSILASLTAQVMAEKTDAARKLTPVAGEVGAPPEPAAQPRWPTDLNMRDHPGGFMSHETMRDAAKDLRRHAASLIEIADALDRYSGMGTDAAQVVDLDALRKQKEREADERVAAANSNAEMANEAIEPGATEFQQRFAEMQAEAQAAVFGKPSADQPSEADEWRCPVHDVPGVTKTSPSSGREFIGCPNCTKFKR